MLETLIELQRLKSLDRTGWTLRGLPNGTESVAAHSFGVAVAAMLIADELTARGVELNVETVLRLAVLHDWAETRVGDMPRTATEYFGAENRKRAETAAFSDLTATLGELSEKYRRLYEDYEQRASVEARVVKAADIIDLLVEVLALERSGARGLDEFWIVATEPNLNVDGPAKEVIDLILKSLLQARSEIIS